MRKHTIEQFLSDYNTITPTDIQVGSAVAQSDWWASLKNQMDDLFWMYYGQRVVFINDRFDPEDDDDCYDNIIKTFCIWLRSKKRMLDGLYTGYIATFNPLWNVDAVIGTVSQDRHTGTDTSAKTGSDTSRQSGSDVNTLGGADVNTLGGSDIEQLSGTDSSELHITKDDTTRTGNETIAKSGTDINSHGVFTFDDTTNSKPSSIDSTEYGSTDTHTYNSVKDAHELDQASETAYGKRDQVTYGKTDTTQYGKTDTMQYGKQDQMTYNNTLTDTRNLQDDHVDMVIRQGNIGVVSSVSLLDENTGLYQNDKFDFYKYVVRMLANEISYAVEGV
ncbi:MAG: hypothetical protein J6Q39_13075 [Bacteroidales bacterium]|nr:hypothetical protein [Bacteroidales bacterium]